MIANDYLGDVDLVVGVLRLAGPRGMSREALENVLHVGFRRSGCTMPRALLTLTDRGKLATDLIQDEQVRLVEEMYD